MALCLNSVIQRNRLIPDKKRGNTCLIINSLPSPSNPANIDENTQCLSVRGGGGGWGGSCAGHCAAADPAALNEAVLSIKAQLTTNTTATNTRGLFVTAET